LLASRKRQLAAITSSAALKADAAESALCGYMAWIALAGLAVNAIWGKSWADPLEHFPFKSLHSLVYLPKYSSVEARSHVSS
jgi:hypothetical protein